MSQVPNAVSVLWDKRGLWTHSGTITQCPTDFMTDSADETFNCQNGLWSGQCNQYMYYVSNNHLCIFNEGAGA